MPLCIFTTAKIGEGKNSCGSVAITDERFSDVTFMTRCHAWTVRGDVQMLFKYH